MREKVTNASKNVIDFLNKHITHIIKGNKVHMQNNTVTNKLYMIILKKHMLKVLYQLIKCT